MCIVSYVNQVELNANKSNRHQRQESLRKIPDSLKNSSLIQQINQEEVNDQMNNSRLPSFLTINNQSALGIVNDDSSLTKFDKLKDMRRMSEI